MSEGDHTPWIGSFHCVQEDRGPSTPQRWRCYIFQDDEMAVAISQGKSQEEALNRARLIVDAVNQRPALLEALKDLAGIIVCSHDSDFYCDERNTGERFCECAPCKAHAKSRAAIAQAEKGAGE